MDGSNKLGYGINIAAMGTYLMIAALAALVIITLIVYAVMKKRKIKQVPRSLSAGVLVIGVMLIASPFIVELITH